ncbi:hypothetical protein [Escherichia coli]
MIIDDYSTDNTRGENTKSSAYRYVIKIIYNKEKSEKL